jgi:ubiquinone/menaquinone biosynthesis C-methylase UbiE
MSEENNKEKVREFYDRVGWKMVNENLYQNARYEDLRPVSADYIHRCHMRINRHLAPEGRFLLDAGSGPVQYPEYLTYSEGYQGRVCMDISIVALKEARKRLGDHGRFVVGDITHLPFKSEAFDGIVSLHTVHHVPIEDKLTVYEEMYRTLNPGKQMVVVNGWTNSPLMKFLEGFERFFRRLHGWWIRRVKGQDTEKDQAKSKKSVPAKKQQQDSQQPTGTFVKKLSAEWLTEMLEGRMDYEIFVWRSVSVSFLRSVIYPEWGGRFWLKVLFWLEERFPRLLGRIGQYPLVVVNKPDETDEKLKVPTEV